MQSTPTESAPLGGQRLPSPDLRYHLQNLHALSVEGAGPVRVVTPAGPWSYAVGVPLQLGGLTGARRPPSAVAVRLRLTVEAGEVGVGLVTADLQAFLDESLCQARPGVQTVDLLAGPVDGDPWLLLRTGSVPGPARVLLHEVEVFRVPAQPVGDGPLAPPAGLALRPVANWGRYYGSCFSSLEEKCRAREYAALKAPKPMPWLGELRVMIYPGNQTSRALYVSGLYEPTDAVVLRQLLPPGGVFLDVGANVGCFTLLGALFAGLGGQVHAFEPSSREYERLTANLRLNSHLPVKAVRAAVVDREGTALLRLAPDEYGGLNTLCESLGYASVSPAGTEEVPTLTLDGYVEAQSLRRVDVIKVDVEGAEHLVLAGAEATLRTYRPSLLVEAAPLANTDPGSRAALAGQLVRWGYRLFGIDPGSATLVPVSDLGQLPGENVVALPEEKPLP